jgi:hypothetical protein
MTMTRDAASHVTRAAAADRTGLDRQPRREKTRLTKPPRAVTAAMTLLVVLDTCLWGSGLSLRAKRDVDGARVPPKYEGAHPSLAWPGHEGVLDEASDNNRVSNSI